MKAFIDSQILNSINSSPTLRVAMLTLQPLNKIFGEWLVRATLTPFKVSEPVVTWVLLLINLSTLLLVSLTLKVGLSLNRVLVSSVSEMFKETTSSE